MISLRPTMFSLAILTLSACGPSTESKRVRIDAGFASSSSMRSSTSKGVTIGTDCYQPQIFLVTHNPVTDRFLERKRIRLRTKFQFSNELCAGITESPETAATDVTTNINKMIQCLTGGNSVIEDSLEVEFKKGIPLDVGIVGTLYPAADLDLDGFCDQNDASQNAPHSYAVLGHTLIPADYEVDGNPYPLSLNVLKSTPAIEYSMTIANIPSVRDWVKLDRNFSGNELREVRYLPDANGEFLIRQKINPTGTTPVFVPHLFPLQLIFKSPSTNDEYSYVHTGGSVAGTTITACKVGADCSVTSNQLIYPYSLTTY